MNFFDSRIYSRISKGGWSALAFALVLAPSLSASASPAPTGHGAEHAGGLSVFTTQEFWLNWPSKEDPRTGFVYLLINFAVLMLILNKLLFKNLRSSTAESSDHIKLQLERASEARTKAEGLLGEYKGRLSKLEEEIAEIKAQAAKLAENEGKAIVAEAKEEAEKILRNATEAGEREGVMRQREIEDEVVDRAVQKAEAIIRKSFGDADQRRLIDSYITEVDAVDLNAERKVG